MKITLIPCFIASSTALVDNTGRFNEMEFSRLTSKFSINIDAKCPKSFSKRQLSCSSKNFQELFIEIEKKAIEYWKEFSKKYLKQYHEMTYTTFHLEIGKNHHGVFAFVVSDFSSLKEMRFYID